MRKGLKGWLGEVLNESLSNKEKQKASSEGDGKIYVCGFCNKTHHEVVKMISGPEDRNICDECISLSYEIIRAGLCNFCHKHRDAVKQVMGGPDDILICDECIVLCHESITKNPDAQPEDPPSLSCSFCGKLQADVEKLIAGPGSHICDECVGLCADIIAEEREREST